MRTRLERLADEKERLQTELVQIHGMLLQIEELIVEEILKNNPRLEQALEDFCCGEPPRTFLTDLPGFESE